MRWCAQYPHLLPLSSLCFTFLVSLSPSIPSPPPPLLHVKISTLMRRANSSFSLRCAFAPVADAHRLAEFASDYPHAFHYLFSQVLGVYMEHGANSLRVDRGGFVMVDTDAMLQLSALAIRSSACPL